MSNETAIGDNAATYTPVAADAGKKIRVQVSFTDDDGEREERTSDAYPSSGTIVPVPLPTLSFAPNEVTVDEGRRLGDAHDRTHPGQHRDGDRGLRDAWFLCDSR